MGELELAKAKAAAAYTTAADYFGHPSATSGIASDDKPSSALCVILELRTFIGVDADATVRLGFALIILIARDLLHPRQSIILDCLVRRLNNDRHSCRRVVCLD
jgi:hypothetical protein